MKAVQGSKEGEDESEGKEPTIEEIERHYEPEVAYGKIAFRLTDWAVMRWQALGNCIKRDVKDDT